MGRIQAPREADLEQEEWERSQAAAKSAKSAKAAKAAETAGDGDRPAEDARKD
jgi:hypothetical protein